MIAACDRVQDADVGAAVELTHEPCVTADGLLPLAGAVQRIAASRTTDRTRRAALGIAVSSSLSGQVSMRDVRRIDSVYFHSCPCSALTPQPLGPVARHPSFHQAKISTTKTTAFSGYFTVAWPLRSGALRRSRTCRPHRSYRRHAHSRSTAGDASCIS